MSKSISILVAAAVAVTSAATSVVPAQALPRIAPAAVEEGGADIQQVARREYRQRAQRHHFRHYPRYHRHRHVYRYPRYRHHHHHHYRSGVGLGVTLGIVGLAAGAIAGGGYYGGLSWQEACARKYRSFNWNTGMYLGYDGHWHRCVLP